MQVTNVCKRILELGPLGTWKRISFRVKRKLFREYWKKRVGTRLPSDKIKPTLTEHAPRSFFKQMPAKAILEALAFPSKDKLLEEANRYTKNIFNLLGSGDITFGNKIPWHKDFIVGRLFPKIFYQDIKPVINRAEQERGADIKVPWELSRFYHLTTLGKAYETTKEEVYTQTFINHVTDWIEENPFLIGVNWVCPMEVSIRAINWILGASFFVDAPGIPQDFWIKLVCSLYDHAYYLKHNPETSDRPNNHYISDLVGEFFLAVFFRKPTKQIQKKVLEQCNHQVQQDGTSYEGSTCYHRLITELFYLFAKLCEAKELERPQDTALREGFHTKLTRMFQFLEDCTVANTLIQIGDNDSGKIVRGITRSEGAPHPKGAPDSLSALTRHYQNFGISIIRDNDWHITFRHPTYHPRQPSGHFHHDQLAITLAYKNIPILIDPGTYLYTSSAHWRNLFRSRMSHNTFGSSSSRNKNDLFQLPREANQDPLTHHITKSGIKLFGRHGNQERNIFYNKEEGSVEVVDGTNSTGLYTWNFLFHPEISVTEEEKGWLISHQEKPLLTMSCSQPFKKEVGFFSPEYGVKEECTRLTTTTAASCLQKVRFSKKRVSDSDMRSSALNVSSLKTRKDSKALLHLKEDLLATSKGAYLFQITKYHSCCVSYSRKTLVDFPYQTLLQNL